MNIKDARHLSPAKVWQLLLIIGFVLAIVCVPAAFAQSDRGTLTGIVTDPLGLSSRMHPS